MRRKGECAVMSGVQSYITTHPHTQVINSYAKILLPCTKTLSIQQKQKHSVVSQDDEKTTRESWRGSFSMRPEGKENPLCSGASFLWSTLTMRLDWWFVHNKHCESHTNPKPSNSVKAACREEEKRRRKRAVDKNKDLVTPNISLDVALIPTLYCKTHGMKI